MAVSSTPVGTPRRFALPISKSRIAAALTVVTTQLRRRTIPLRQAISDHWMSVIGLGCIDTGVFTANTVAGWIVTGLTVLALEYKASE